jgi:hypothetical protein
MRSPLEPHWIIISLEISQVETPDRQGVRGLSYTLVFETA